MSEEKIESNVALKEWDGKWNAMAFKHAKVYIGPTQYKRYKSQIHCYNYVAGVKYGPGLSTVGFNITVVLEDHVPKFGRVFLKNYSEGAGVLNAMLEAGHCEVEDYVPQGFCNFILVKLSKDFMLALGYSEEDLQDY